MYSMKALTKKQKISIVTAVVVVVAGSLIWVVRANGATPAPTLRTATAVKGNIAVSIEADGIVTAEKAVANFAQTGVLRTLNVKVGDNVKTGDVLAALDSSKLYAQVSQAQSTYSANLEKASRLGPTGEEVVVKQRAVDAARSALTAEQSIYADVVAKSGAGSSQELAEAAKLHKAETDVTTAEAQLALTSATYKDAQYTASASYANLQVARSAVYDTEITAPIDGVVVSVNGLVGQTVGGQSSGTTTGFITIARLDNLSIVSALDEEDVAKVKAGQQIEADITALGATLKGVVMFVSPVAKTDQNGGITYEVHTSFEKGEYTVLDGMSATVKFITKSVADVVVIPNKAVKRVDGVAVVLIPGIGETTKNLSITTGFTDGTSVAVTGGLNEGDKYLVAQ